MNSSRLVIHIGLHKTGTTFLQSQLWPMYESVELVKGWDTMRSTMHFDLDKQVIISDEGLSGRLFAGKYLRDFNRNMDRIQRMFGNPKIIVGFRKQDSWVVSNYKQYLHQGGMKNFEAIFNPEGTAKLKPEELFFQPRIDLLKSMFTDVFIYTQEGLLKDRKGTVDALGNFIGLKEKINYSELENLAKSNMSIRTVRQVNRLIKLNRINKRMASVPIIPSWYSRPFKKMKLTPRHICRDYMNNEKGEVFALKPEIKDFMSTFYADDWQYVLENRSV